MTGRGHRVECYPSVRLGVVGLGVGKGLFGFLTSKDVETAANDRSSNAASRRGHQSPSGPLVCVRVVDFIYRHVAAHSSLPSPDGVKAAVHGSHGQVIPRGWHREERLPRVRCWIIDLERPQDLAPRFSPDRINLPPENPDCQGTAGSRHRGLPLPAVLSWIVFPQGVDRLPGPDPRISTDDVQFTLHRRDSRMVEWLYQRSLLFPLISYGVIGLDSIRYPSEEEVPEATDHIDLAAKFGCGHFRPFVGHGSRRFPLSEGAGQRGRGETECEGDQDSECCPAAQSLLPPQVFWHDVQTQIKGPADPFKNLAKQILVHSLSPTL